MAASSSRFLGGALVVSESISRRVEAVISATARLVASRLRREGLRPPDTLRTNCAAAASTSASVAGGWKLFSGLMFLHILPGR